MNLWIFSGKKVNIWGLTQEQQDSISPQLIDAGCTVDRTPYNTLLSQKLLADIDYLFIHIDLEEDNEMKESSAVLRKAADEKVISWHELIHLEQLPDLPEKPKFIKDKFGD